MNNQLPECFNDWKLQLPTSKVHTCSFLGYKTYLKQNIIDLYRYTFTILQCYICQKPFNLLTLFHCDIRYMYTSIFLHIFAIKIR